jgi:hypoxanthine-guanine phosphoribosyltransferase
MLFKKKLLLPQKTIQKKVKELSDQISSDYANKDTVLIGILNGAVFFLLIWPAN